MGPVLWPADPTDPKATNLTGKHSDQQIICRKPGAALATRPCSAYSLALQGLVWSGGEGFCSPTPVATIRWGAWEAVVIRVEGRRFYFTQLPGREAISN